mgnify:CR=1 FL=1|tara:strand:- start:308 stop:583 length:276 start_codon:yes stop_codon:yes gene_type:complete
MRKIEEQMWEAINSLEGWQGGNTAVSQTDSGAMVFLHGHHIATVNAITGKVTVNKRTLAEYPTNTTKSRLRALGVDVYTKKGSTYLDGAEV